MLRQERVTPRALRPTALLVGEEEQPNAETERLLERVDELLQQQAEDNAEDSAWGVPDLSGIDLGRELDDYDHERPESAPPDAGAQEMEAGTITEVGARTESPFGGTAAHPQEERYGGARPASMGPYGGPVAQRGHRANRKAPLGDETEEADRLFANRRGARAVPGDDSEDVGET
ncbi:MAG TPA: hypothetical protein VFB21_01140 [Chthonomonadaceae bacterium]|nr:hypothetical protein [Chthonomonadaceae bacterium]